MKNTLITLSISILSFNMFASTENYQFIAADDATESALCVIAAKEGYQAALKESINQGIPVSHFTKQTKCNGTSVKAFAKKYTVAEPAPIRKIKLVASNDSPETQLCLQAATFGMNSLTTDSSVNLDRVYCNGKRINTFSKAYSKL